MNAKLSLRLGAFVVAIAAALWFADMGTSDTPDATPPETTTPASAQTSGSSTAPGMVAHVDPVTGEILETPPPSEVYAAEKRPHQVQSAPEPDDGGGEMIRLNGAFEHSMVATVEPGEKPTAECVPSEQAPQCTDETHDHDDEEK